MKLFAVLPRTPVQADLIRKRIEELGGNALPLDIGGWLVASDGTSAELATSLGILGEIAASAMVLGIDGYSGRAPSTVWEWMKTKLEAKPSA